MQRLLTEQVQQIRGVLTSDAVLAAAHGTEELSSLATYVVSVAQALAVMHRAGTPIDDLRSTARHALRALDTAPSVKRTTTV